MAIEPGDEYLSCKPTESMPNGHPTRIRVVGKPASTWGMYGYGKVDFVTVTETGREVRRRAIEVNQLHETATTKSGTARKSGYVRVTPANPTTEKQ